MATDKFKTVDIVLNNINKDIIPNQDAMEGEKDGRSLTVQVKNGGMTESQTGLGLNLGWTHQSAKNNEGEVLEGLDAFMIIDNQKGIYQIEYPSGMMVAGSIKATIQFVDAKGGITYSRPFLIRVAETPFSEKAATSTNTFSALTAALVKAEQNNAGVVDIVNSYDELLAKYPNGARGSVVVMDADGKQDYIYIYDGNNWKKGSSYIPDGVANDSINLPKLDPDIRKKLSSAYKQDLEVKTGYLTYDSKTVTNINPYNGYRTIVANCSPGQVWNCDVSVNADTTSACIFWKIDGTYFSDLERGAGKVLENYQFVIPDQVYSVSVTSKSDYEPILRLHSTTDTVKLSHSVDEIENRMLVFDKQDLKINVGYLTYDSKVVTNISTFAGFRTIVANCSPGQVWNCDVSVNADTTSACIFWKTDGTFFKDLERGAGKVLENYQFVIPEGVRFVSVTSLADYEPTLRLRKETDSNGLLKVVEGVDTRLLTYTKQDLEVKTGFLTYDSKTVTNINPYNGYRTVVAECLPGQVWNCDVSVNADTTSACIFWKTDGTYFLDLERGAGKTLIDYQVTIPEGVRFVSVTSLADGVVPVLRLRENGELYKVDKRVSVLEAKIIQPETKRKRIANFGDSIYGNFRPPQDISTVISSILESEVYNLGFGGCMMAQRNDQEKWDAWSMHALSNAVATNDFSAQEAAITQSGLPSYFRGTFDLLKSLNFAEIDICTIAYGTNDYTFTTGGASIPLDDATNPYNIKTYKGALRYSLENLYKANPKIQIVLCSPVYRFWLNEDGSFLIDSDKNPINGLKLTDFVKAVGEVAYEYKLPYFDAYNDLGFNKQTRDVFFPATDTTHPNLAGRTVIGTRVAHFLKEKCW